MTRTLSWTAPILLASAAVLAACQPATTSGRYDPVTGVYIEPAPNTTRLYEASDGAVFRTRARRDAYEAELRRAGRRGDLFGRTADGLYRASDGAVFRNRARRDQHEANLRRQNGQTADGLYRASDGAVFRNKARRDEHEANLRRKARQERRRNETGQTADGLYRASDGAVFRNKARRDEHEANLRRAARQERRRNETGQTADGLYRASDGAVFRNKARRDEHEANLRRAARQERRRQNGLQAVSETGSGPAWDWYNRRRRPGETFAAFQVRYDRAVARASRDGGSVGDYLQQQGQRDSE